MDQKEDSVSKKHSREEVFVLNDQPKKSKQERNQIFIEARTAAEMFGNEKDLERLGPMVQKLTDKERDQLLKLIMMGGDNYYPGIVSLLMKQGANLRHGVSAVLSEEYELPTIYQMKDYLENGGIVNGGHTCPLICCMKNIEDGESRREFVRLLLQYGANPNTAFKYHHRYIDDLPDDLCRSPLLAALDRNDPYLLRLLIEYGADHTKYGYKLWHWYDEWVSTAANPFKMQKWYKTVDQIKKILGPKECECEYCKERARIESGAETDADMGTRIPNYRVIL